MPSFNIIKKDGKIESVSVDTSDVDNKENQIENTNSEIPVTEPKKEKENKETISQYPIEVIKEEVVKVLKLIFDPEIPVNVYELGLIYDIKVATNGDVLVVMTLTSPSCPVAGSLPTEIEDKLKEHPMINDAKVQITFDPPWDMNKMSEEAKLELGFL
ncbi:MAG TPA: hypothetical protein DEP28_08520 [Bacteroidetes bacterium]|nr:hypothetical protein [Bacteroidota bacterium]HCN37952.1 hypothetical protein [Bacteroidota bacterium]